MFVLPTVGRDIMTAVNNPRNDQPGFPWLL